MSRRSCRIRTALDRGRPIREHSGRVRIDCGRNKNVEWNAKRNRFVDSGAFGGACTQANEAPCVGRSRCTAQKCRICAARRRKRRTPEGPRCDRSTRPIDGAPGAATAQSGGWSDRGRAAGGLGMGLIGKAGHAAARASASAPGPITARVRWCSGSASCSPAPSRARPQSDAAGNAGAARTSAPPAPRADASGGKPSGAAGGRPGLARDPAGPDDRLTTAAARREPPQLQVRRRAGGQRRGFLLSRLRLGLTWRPSIGSPASSSSRTRASTVRKPSARLARRTSSRTGSTSTRPTSTSSRPASSRVPMAVRIRAPEAGVRIPAPGLAARMGQHGARVRRRPTPDRHRRRASARRVRHAPRARHAARPQRPQAHPQPSVQQPTPRRVLHRRRESCPTAPSKATGSGGARGVWPMRFTPSGRASTPATGHGPSTASWPRRPEATQASTIGRRWCTSADRSRPTCRGGRSSGQPTTSAAATRIRTTACTERSTTCTRSTMSTTGRWICSPCRTSATSRPPWTRRCPAAPPCASPISTSHWSHPARMRGTTPPPASCTPAATRTPRPDVGSEIDVTLRARAWRVGLEAGYGYFMGGGYLRESDFKLHSAHFFYLQTTVGF